MKDDYRKLRLNVDTNIKLIYDEAVKLAERVDAPVRKPRIIGKQQHRSNADSVSIYDHYKKNLVIPFLDHVSNQLNDRFSESSRLNVGLLALVPSILCDPNNNLEDSLDIDAVKDQFATDLPKPEILHSEIERWRLLWNRRCNMLFTLPTSAAATLKFVANETEWPNLNILFRIVCTIPATSCEAERSASVIRRLNAYTRASQGQERMSALALIHINYDSCPTQDEIVDRFACQKPRRMRLKFLTEK